MGFILRLLLTALVFYLLPRFVHGIHVDSPTAALIAAVVFGIVNAIIRPLILLLTLAITLLTLGLFIIVINALMFWIAAWITPGFRVDTFGAAVIGAVVMMVVGFIASHTFRDEAAPTTA
ncbi:MAG TPA: phage holin family protein [Candidatus Baltobacteraceae bacterium]|nr:phage holin family protein [Candidatus Baltobacteraceae bacterium]